jgi:hypothetical protein
MTKLILGAGVLLTAALACGGKPVSPAGPLPTLADVTPAEWATLASRRVFFGHQSVGGNIVQGLQEVLAGHPEIRLTLFESKDLGGNAAPGFYHAWVGANANPDLKVAEFVHIAANGLPVAGSVGMVKLCYVDVQPDSDPVAMFAAYQERIESLRAQNPGLTIVHFTMPLTIVESAWFFLKAKIRHYHTERDRNAIRNRYNELLRRAYAGKEPVFDIAALESRRPDGTISYFRWFSGPVPKLVQEYTTDGGHLNEVGRRMVAEQLLIFLAKLPAAGGSARATS